MILFLYVLALAAVGFTCYTIGYNKGEEDAHYKRAQLSEIINGAIDQLNDFDPVITSSDVEVNAELKRLEDSFLGREPYSCGECNFVAKNDRGLSIHEGKMHN